MKFAEVAVFTLLPKGDVFDYLLPESGKVRVGMRVRVPFGNSFQKGVVTELKSTTQIAPEKLRILQLPYLDDEPLPEAAIGLIRWIKNYYHCTYKQAWKLIYPSAVMSSVSLSTVQRWYRLTATGRRASIARNARLQQRLYEQLLEGPVNAENVGKKYTNSLRLFEHRGWVHCERRGQTAGHYRPPNLPEINSEQRRIVNQMIKPAKEVSLLEGVAGAGKTRIYMHLAAHHLALGKQCLLLVPEIGLTQQNVALFRALFDDRVFLYHSSLADNERRRSWIHALAGTPGVFIGTRSAAFLPLKNPAIFMMDEEHDTSYFQLQAPFYNARGALLMHARLHAVNALLATATPALETLANALNGRYDHLKLSRRATGVPLPRLHLIDVRGSPMRGGVSAELIDLMRTHLKAGGQVMLFLNRRGYAPARICHGCGYTERCPRCERTLTYHRSSHRLCCHVCQWWQRAADFCSVCEQGKFRIIGYGTERIAHFLRTEFAEYASIQLDHDTVKNVGYMNVLLTQIYKQEVQIIVGTQMVSKGYHMPGISLVAILDADQGLMSSDFRAHEHVAQQLSQVTGRAGRSKPGAVAIQTHHPHHPLLEACLTRGYEGFSRTLLAQRQQALLPPFCHHAVVRAECLESEIAKAFLRRIREQLPEIPGLSVSPPLTPPLQKKAGFWRWILVLESEARSGIHVAVDIIEKRITDCKRATKLRVSLIIDPLSLE